MKQKRGNILLIEDNQFDRLAFERFAQREDFPYDYMMVPSFMGACQILDSHQFDAIAMDYLLDDGTAVDLLKLLKQQLKNIPTIIVTGAGNEEVAIQAIRAGVYDYIIKDADCNYLEALAITVEKAIAWKEKEEELDRHRKYLEELTQELTQKNQQLQDEIQERKKVEKKLQEHADELEMMNSNQNKFFSIISHDLRSPFYGLTGISEVLVQDYDELGEEEIKESVVLINRTAKNLFNLLENLLEWSRFQTGKINYTPKKTKLSDLINHTISLYESTALQKRVQMLSAIETEAFLYTDRYMIDTVLRNLVSNAIKFTDTGGTVAISATHHDEHIEIAITDTGVGIDEESINKLFRTDIKHSTMGTNGEKGTGLGLILCSELIKKNKGKLWVTSQEGQGSTFIITVPITPIESLDEGERMQVG